MKFLVLLLTSFIFPIMLMSQLSPNAKVYLLTCDPGNEIYTQFGHSALRISDPEASIDFCYNWGMFEFGDDEFEFNMKFAKGKLPYYMAIQPYEVFIAEYVYFGREVRQMELNMTQDQKNELFNALKINYLPENRTYKYDFFFDNCASRISDFLVTVLGDKLELGNHKDADLYTYRNLISPRLANHPWTLFGINLVLGSRIDVSVSNKNLQFLPEYMEEVFLVSKVIVNETKEPFVLSSSVLIKGQPSVSEAQGWFLPNVLSWSIFSLFVVLLFVRWHKVLKVFGIVLILATSILGMALLLMWFGTDHSATKVNYNLVWANPLLFVLPFLMLTNTMFKRMHYVFKSLAFIHLMFIVLWILIPQEFDLPTKGLILSQGLLFYTWQKESKSTAK